MKSAEQVMIHRNIVCAAVFGLAASCASAQEAPRALARPDLTRSSIADLGASLDVTLTLSQPVPWRVFTLDAPPRLVVDFSEVDWTGQDPASILASDKATTVTGGPFIEGWSRLVLGLAGPLALDEAAMETGLGGGAATLRLRLSPIDAVSFSERAGTPEGAGPSGSDLVTPQVPLLRQTGDRRLVVMLDPGHGGIDPGAEADGVAEADLMLRFARDLERVLEATDRFTVRMTRRDDSFVSLGARVALARAARADAFVSLHADALAEGRAHGATVYTLSQTASDAASGALAERHDRGDLLAGVDLGGQDDRIAGVLMDLARLNTTPRSEHLARTLVEGLAERTGELHKRPRLRAGFTVLKAPDIPSALIELGFLSSARDRARLVDPGWRLKAAKGIRDGLLRWADEDAAQARLSRR